MIAEDQCNPDSDGSEPAVHVVMGDPLLSRSAEIYRQKLAEAGVEGAERAVPPAQRPLGRTSFHVVMSAAGEPVGVMRASLGTLDQLSLGELIDSDKRPHGLICECPLIAVEPGAPEGTTELLYRSVYVFARRHGAEHLVRQLEPEFAPSRVERAMRCWLGPGWHDSDACRSDEVGTPDIRLDIERVIE